MYSFVDTTEVFGGMITELPSEALQINGEYIENLILGYRTLNVSGREALSPDVSTYETGVRDGSTLKGKRYPARILTVTYQLIAASNEAFRDAYNQLGKILDVEDAKLIFYDEQDKFYTGTPSTIGEVSPGKNAVVGKFEIVCTDPFKYSVAEHTAMAYGTKDVTIFYDGTYKARPILEVDFYEEKEVADDGETSTELTGAGDCGYVAFFDDEENIIQIGDPEEADKEEGFEPSQTLMNQTFLSETAWGTTAKALWSVNNGHIMANNVTQEGNVAMGYAYYNSQTTTTTSSGYTSGTIGEFQKAGESKVFYKVTYSTNSRTANSVSVTVSVKMWVLQQIPKTNINFSLKLSNGTVFDGGLVAGSGQNTYIGAGNTYSVSRTKTITGLSSSQKSIGVASFGAYGNSDVYVNSTAANSISISAYSTSTNTQTWAEYYLTPNSYGSSTSGWHGPTITRAVPADTSGEVGATDFCLTYKQKMSTNSSSGGSQVGSFRMNLTDADGGNVAGIWIYKNKSGKTGNLVFFVNGVKVNETPIDLHYKNTYFGDSEDAVQTTTVTKSGGTITFAVGSYKRTFTETALADVKAASVTFSFEKYGELTAMEYNGIYWAKFVKNNCPTWRNIPNKFSANDVLTADCKTGEIFLNGIYTPDLGAIGNNWEGFYLKPGLNHIGMAYSEWVTDEYMPVFKIRFQEVFL